MQTLTATDVQIIWTWMKISYLERELKENRDLKTHKELSDWARKLKKQNLRSMIKRYKRLLKWAGRMQEFEHYMELKAERDMEEQRMRAYDEREEQLEEVWLEEYDMYND